MNFLEVDGGDGYPILGLISEGAGTKRGNPLILHVHGFGGDHYSNRFVRVAHAVLPEAGFGFASIELPTSGYVTERYSDHGVRYVGSAITDPEQAVDCVRLVAEHFLESGRKVILQGHSFGSNIVRRFASTWPALASGYVFLSAADSLFLLEQYSASRGPIADVRCSEAHEITWDSFGIATPDRSYPIPIDEKLLASLPANPVFTAWSDPQLDRITRPWLFMRSRGDSISKSGTLEHLSMMLKGARLGTVVELGGSSHSFTGQVGEMLSRLVAWLRGLPSVDADL